MTASAWTQDRIDRLKELWSEGQTADQIARDLANGISRNAVLGKVHRMGLSAGRAADKARPARKVALVTTPCLHAPVATQTLVQAAPVPAVGRATLLTVKRYDCRWPLGDPLKAGFSLCGEQVARGAYCACHAEIAYRAARETTQSLERLIRLT